MKTISPELQDYIVSPAKDIGIRAFRKDNTDTYQSIEVTALEGSVEIDNDFWILTKDSLTLSVPNTNNVHQPENQMWIWDNPERIAEEIKLEIDYPSYTWPGLRFVPLFTWNIYWTKSWFWSKLTSLYLLTDKQITGELTTSLLYENKKPYEIVEIIMGMLWLPVSINKNTSIDDEAEYTVRYISWYKANAFSELQQLVEVAWSYLVWNSSLNSYVYYTKAYIDSLKALVTLPYSFTDIYDPDNTEFGLAHVLEINKEFRTNNIINFIGINANSYKIKTNETAYTFSVALNPWEIKNLDQKLSEGEFYTWYTVKLNSATTWEDGSGDDFSQPGMPAVIESSFNTYPNWISWYIKNNHTSKLYINLSVNSSNAKIPDQIEKIYLDSISIWKYGKKWQNLSNKYIQSVTCASAIWERVVASKKDPECVIQLTIVWNPAIDVLDPARIDLSTTWETYRWIIKRINSTYNINTGFRQILEFIKI